jgi:hypothetical protein
VPPSEAQFAEPESLSGPDVGVVVVVDGLVVVVEGRVVVVDRWGPALDAAAPEVADANAILTIASPATVAAAASVLFLDVKLRISVLSVVDASWDAPGLVEARLLAAGLERRVGSITPEPSVR